MEKNVFTINLFCRIARQDKDGKAPLYLSINKRKQRKLISLGAKLHVKYWDDDKSCIHSSCPNKSYYDLLIANKKHEINKRITQANLDDVELTIDDFGCNKATEKQVLVKNQFEIYIQELESEDRIKNAKYYKCCLNSLLDFTQGRNLEFKQIDVAFLNDYAHWMQMERKLHKNTIGNRLKGLKAVFNRAIASKSVSKDIYPFDDFKVTKYREDTVKRAIPKETIEKIINLSLQSISTKHNYQYYEFAKDIFIFSYLGCGINLVDIAHLRYENIVDGERIQFRRSKTKKLISFKLLPLAKEIIGKYSKDNPSMTDYIFPIITYGKHDSALDIYRRINYRTKHINLYLKKIGEYLHIPLSLTSYVARHSFATVLKRSGINTSVISEAMGHSSEKVTQIYLDSFENSQIDEAMKHLL